MDTQATRLSDAPDDPTPILSALKRSRGRATVGDIVSETGLPRDEVESGLRTLLEGRRGHLEVGETGALVYRFDPKLLRRDAEPALNRLLRRSRAVLREAFKVWIVLMLVVYFLVFVALLIAAVVASQSRGGGKGRSRDFGLGRRRGGGMPGFWFWYFFWSPGWGWRRPYYGHRWEERYGGKGRQQQKVPFIKKVFAFVFGPDSPKPTQRQKDRSIIRLIRARKGVLTATELVQHAGMTLPEAEEEMARLMAAYDGDVRVTPGGTLVYLFPELMLSAKGRVEEREPDPAWRRLEPAESWTGNKAGSNVLIAGINGFNLAAASTAPWFIFPELGLGGPLAWIGLVWVPAVFSVLFFAIPLFRYVGVETRNRQRQERNLRKVLLAHVFQASLASKGPLWITSAGTVERARALLLPGPGQKKSLRAIPAESNLPPEQAWGPGFQGQLQRLLAEFDGEVKEGSDGTARYRFPEILRAFQGAEVMRQRLALDQQEVGEIVYASDDSPEEADQRQVEAWEREMARQEAMDRYLPDPNRMGYLDEFELVAFESQPPGQKAGSAGWG